MRRILRSPRGLSTGKKIIPIARPNQYKQPRREATEPCPRPGCPDVELRAGCKYYCMHDNSSDLMDALSRRALELGPEMEHYLRYHRRRFFLLTDTVSQLIAATGQAPEQIRLLDVGPSFQTLMFHYRWPKMTIDTFGFADPKFPAPVGGKHVAYDLNDSYQPSCWPKASLPYDIIVMAEVIEHLYTSPVPVLACLASMLSANGSLVVTTPNAVALPKRLRVFLGANPNEMIRENRENPGHYREYTATELRQVGATAGLAACACWLGSATNTGSLTSRLYALVTPWLPQNLRKDIAITFRKQH